MYPPHKPSKPVYLFFFSHQGDAEEEPTAGALELVDPEEEFVVEGGAEVEGDGDAADDRDEEGNVDDDGDVGPPESIYKLKSVSCEIENFVVYFSVF